ncbi:MAG: hypothetical protein EX270_06455 [Pseudomonadales bacterium]|nr:MAG: hypothetical protein EX270_06455 [Pseudomonadales bacterium]
MEAGSNHFMPIKKIFHSCSTQALGAGSRHRAGGRLVKCRHFLAASILLAWPPLGSSDDASLDYRPAGLAIVGIDAASRSANVELAKNTLANPASSGPSPIDNNYPVSAAEPSETVLEIPSDAQTQSTSIQAMFFSESLARQRQIYRQAHKALDDGDLRTYAQLRNSLEDYPLLSFLDYQRIARSGILDAKTIAGFDANYDNSRLTRKLQRQQLRTLARNRQWRTFIENYNSSTKNTRLRCQYAHALFETGERQAAISLSTELWLTPSSMPDVCDPAFHELKSGAENFPDLAWQRFDGAYRAAEMTLARYLERFLDARRKPQAKQLLEAYASVNMLGKQWQSRLALLDASFAEPSDKRQVLALWVKRLARQDLDAAVKLIGKRLVKNDIGSLPAAQSQLLLEELQPYVITRYALGDYNRLPAVYKKIGKPLDQKSLEWLIRAHIAKADWKKLPGMIALLPPEARDSERWKFWTLRAKQLAGQLAPEEKDALAVLADAASFYGFAAARYSNTHFRLQPQHYTLSEKDLQTLASSLHLRKAIEHFIHAEIEQANSSWAIGLREIDNQNWLMAAYLASRLGWHQQAILTAARADAWRHYAIRFPRIASDEFAQQGLRYNQPPEWFYATARQESALASHARSSAGAVGLMQLLPSTAKAVAKSLDREYDKAQLFEANYSIDLGSSYLDQLYQQFGNRALGSAAYNAGPHRVSAWLKNLRKPIPLEAWIETIRFSETRQYVQNILSFGLIHAALYNGTEPAAAGAPTADNLQEQASISRPWPVFSFIGEPEGMVKPYSQQVRRDDTT